MGQQEVYDFLMKHPDLWFTSKQISEQLVVSIGSVTMSLKKLRKTNIIKFRNTGKRNTFQYMVQSEPAKLAERTMPSIEQHAAEHHKIKVKIKPKIVHQHTYLGGQTFYGVIRPKEEANALSRDPAPVSSYGDDDSDDEPAPRAVKRASKPKVAKRKAARKPLARRLTSARIKASKPKMRKQAKTRMVRKATKPKRAMKRARR